MWQTVREGSRRTREQVCTSIIVAAELRFGVWKRGSSILAERVEQLLTRLTVLPLQPDVDSAAGGLREAGPVDRRQRYADRRACADSRRHHGHGQPGLI
ncbi:PIN domain-containing protein [Burkholderia ubonensis]|uniref:PIN domain-containing protein n=1 Tax=Burkholderia ubonensis TaxID=101571 RepID=UPI002FC83F63